MRSLTEQNVQVVCREKEADTASDKTLTVGVHAPMEAVS